MSRQRKPPFFSDKNKELVMQAVLDKALTGDALAAELFLMWKGIHDQSKYAPGYSPMDLLEPEPKPSDPIKVALEALRRGAETH